MNKKFTALLTAVSLVLPLCHVALADPAPTQPEVTVVGKRITGDDTYFEISLEVNRDYEEYSAVGVVLRYDPAYIVPAESWDEDAGELDLYTEGARTWGTRRALPTLGKDTWSTQTALAYEDDFLDLTSGTSKKWGYLYLGAEYPGTTPDDSSATASPGVATPSPTPTPTVDPSVTPDPDIYQNPVVAVRFMYKEDADTLAGVGDSAAARKATKEKLEQTWLDTAGNGANSWDGANWPNNEILTIASDDIAKTSPAQYPFAYYRADLEEYAYLHTWPSPAPTADPSGTPLPIDVQLNLVKEVGADVDPAHQLGDGDIEICLGEGKSAKATGGLSLNDIYLILFYDWDDTLLGTLTAGVGLDMTEDVNSYIEENFIHPDLHMDTISDTYPNLVSSGDHILREFSYRGKFPYDAPDPVLKNTPGGSNTYPDTLPDGSDNPKAGSKYPLTNKLDYTLAGKAYDPDHPFANCWTQVTLKDVNYDPDGEFDEDCDYLLYAPKKLEDTWTALEWDKVVEPLVSDSHDEWGWFDDPDANFPDIAVVDFSNITADTLKNTDGNLYVKAVYEAGDELEMDSSYYTAVGLPEFTTYGAITASSAVYAILLQLQRVTIGGYGVTRAKEPKFRVEVTQFNADDVLIQSVDVKNGEEIDVEMIASKQVDCLEYYLGDQYNANIVNCLQISDMDEDDREGYGAFFAEDDPHNGFTEKCTLGYVVDLCLSNNQASINNLVLNDIDVKKATGADYGSRDVTAAIRTSILNFVNSANADANISRTYSGKPLITYYQLQWALLNNGAYLDAAAAEAACTDPTTGYSWCQ